MLGYACSCSQELAEKAIQGANEAFKKWSVTPLEERARALRKLARLVEENRYYIDAWNVEESGKNWGEADGELCELLDFIEFIRDAYEQIWKKDWSLCLQMNIPNVSIFQSV